MRETPLILVVDDDPGILGLVQEILSPSYQVTTASSVKEARKHLQDQGCDLVLTDMVMPEAGGMELLKYLRLHHVDIPVIVFTGYANFQDAVNAVKLGAFDYLTKPIQIEILQHTIARALEFRRLYSQQKDLEVVFRGAEALGWQALELISGTQEAALLTSLRESWAEAGTLPEAAQRFLEGIEQLLGVTRTSIFLYDDERDNFTGLVARGPEAEARLAANVPANNSLMGYVAHQRRPLLVVDLELDQRVALWVRRFPFLSPSFIIIPLIGSKFWGVLNLTDREDNFPFTSRDLFLAWLSGRLLVEILEAQAGVCEVEAAPSPPLGDLLQVHFSQGVALVDRDLRIIQANSALVKLLRAKGEELVGQEISALLGLGSEESRNLKDALAWVMENQEARQVPTLKCSLENGKTHFLGVRLIPCLQPQGPGHGILVVEDLSELEKLKQRLHLYEHLAIMGKLSLCVAHELNNPLDGVYRFVSLAQKKKDDPQEVARYLDEAQKGLQKMSMTIRSLLSSANPLKAPPKTDSLLNLLQEAVRIMMFQASDQRVQVSLHAPKGLNKVPVEGDLYHVFINIIKNALQAMPKGGKLKVDGNIGSQDIAIHFQDSGSGLTHEELGQIFQPFYSTKEGTQGLGLGLPICRKILERYAGQLVVESQPGKGTRVTILLPKSSLGENLVN
jgi:signal transduction histidine kinase/CheY-like chemotaxis protein